MPELLYLIGSPASGKSTLFDALTAGLRSTDQELCGVPVVAWTTPNDVSVVELGKRRESFSGTDALSMSIQPKAIDLLGQGYPLIMGEGDRLANNAFFQAVKDHDYDLKLFWLDTPQQVLEDRRAARALFDKPQNRTWLKGRDTKVLSLALRWKATRIPGTLSTAAQLRILEGSGGWVVDVLRGGVHA